MKKVLKGLVKNQVKKQVSRILPRIEESVNATLEAEVLTRSSHSSRTSNAIAADLSEMELKKILIEKMEGNKSIQRSDEQRNLYKALVEAYEADKAILDTYVDSTILKRRREDDDQEGPSRNLCRLPVRWRKPHIWCLRQVPMINQLFKHLSILNGFPSHEDHLHRIVLGIQLCQLLKEMLNHG
nr:hypothetical protein [Tanacetum cinerariifolium]